MNRYVKLVNFELSRFIKIYIALIAITIVSQLTGVIVLSKKYLENAKQIMQESSLTQSAFVEMYGAFSFDYIMESIWFIGPIALSVVGLLLYVVLIWYRDWFGKNTFIYRLLMIPTARINIYFAKATAIFLMVLGLVSIQLMLFPVINRLIKLLVPIGLRTDLSVNEMIDPHSYLAIFFPGSFIDFFIHYGIGFMAVFVIFTAILFERSFRIKGFFMGFVYFVLASGLFLSPMIMMIYTQRSYLYPMELFILQIVLGLFVTGMSILVSRFLLNRKITI